jgi:hypothetical protein
LVQLKNLGVYRGVYFANTAEVYRLTVCFKLTAGCNNLKQPKIDVMNNKQVIKTSSTNETFAYAA